MDLNELMDEGRVARLLDVTRDCLQGWRVRGNGPRFVKIGRLVRYRMNDITQFIEDQTRSSTRQDSREGAK